MIAPLSVLATVLLEAVEPRTLLLIGALDSSDLHHIAGDVASFERKVIRAAEAEGIGAVADD